MADFLNHYISKLEEYKTMLSKADACIAQGPYVWGTTPVASYIKAVQDLASIFGFPTMVRREPEAENKMALVFRGNGDTCTLFDSRLHKHNWAHDSVLSYVFETAFPKDVYLAEIVHDYLLRVCFHRHVQCVQFHGPLYVPCQERNLSAKRQQIRDLENIMKQAQTQISALGYQYIQKFSV